MVTSIAALVAGRSWSFTYDGMDRLITADNLAGVNADDRSFAYDDADNMVWNSGLNINGSCSASPNMAYPTAGPSAIRPHAPTSICGAAVAYDANGNTTSYDVDGSGPTPPRNFAYDLENRPLSITQNGLVTRFAYGPDGARSLKVAGTKSYSYFGGEELLQDGSLLALTSTIAADIRREVILNQSPQQFGTTDFALKDQKCESAWNKDPVAGLSASKKDPTAEWVQSVSRTWRPDWNACCGNDCKDQTVVFCSGHGDQVDLPGAWCIAEGRAESDPLGRERVPL
jgi:uncharacterized protein RhaS with RHS repeats